MKNKNVWKFSIIFLTSLMLVTSCNGINRKEIYQEALQKYEENEYYECLRLLSNLRDYKDSEAYRISCNQNIEYYEENLFNAQTLPLDLKVNDTINFGIYQKEKGPEENFKDHLEWTVLDIKDEKALLITSYTIDCIPYNDTLEEVTWESCSLREYLNSYFYSIAFNDNLRNKIVETEISQSQNVNNNATLGATTLDKVFILSNEELEHYIPDMYDRCSSVTNYALNKGLYASNLFSIYWTRSIGCYDNPNLSECFCNFRGIIDTYGNKVDNKEYGIRPCIWIDLYSAS